MRILLSSLLLSLSISHVNGQAGTDSASTSGQQASVLLYTSAMGANAALYNAPEYYYDDARLTANAFFETADFDRGTIVYDNIEYRDIPLAYDILRDEVVSLSFNQDFRIKLLPEKLSSFTLRDHRFIQLPKTGDSHSLNGYFEVLQAGKLQLLAKRSKKIRENINSGRDVEYQVYSENKYYVGSGSEYRAVSDKSELLSALPDKRNELSAFVEKNNLAFRDNLELALHAAVRYYDQISAE